MAQKLNEGDIFPSFILPNHEGELVEFSAFIGKYPIVLFFYPKDNTPGCIAEVKSFNDTLEQFQNIGAKVFGVSSDSIESHHKFACKYELNYPLLCDEDGSVRNKTFGVPKDLFGLIDGRCTYVADIKGKIIKIYDALSGKHHNLAALDALKDLGEQ